MATATKEPVCPQFLIRSSEPQVGAILVMAQDWLGAISSKEQTQVSRCPTGGVYADKCPSFLSLWLSRRKDLG